MAVKVETPGRTGRLVSYPLVLALNSVLVALALTGGISLALAVVLAGSALVAILRRPQRGLLVLAALSPFNGLLLIADLPSAAAGWKELLVLFTLGATFVSPEGSRGRPGRRLPGWTAAVIGLGVLALASAVVVGGVQAAVGLKISLFYVLVAVIAWRCPLSSGERDLLVSIIMVAGVATSAVGLAQQVVGAERLSQLGYEYNSTIRFSGDFLRSFSTFNQPFPFGFFVALSLLIGIPQALTEPGRIRNQLFVMATPLLVLGVLSTFVRGAWLALAIGLAYLASKRYRVLLLLVPVGLVLLVFLPPDISSSAFSAKSSIERTESWLQNADLVLDHPLGAGIGTAGSASEKVAALQEGVKAYQPDNYYFKVLVELGVLGLWFLVLLLVSAYRSSRQAVVRLSGRDAALAEGVSAFILASAAAAMVATYFEIFPMDLFFWLLLGVIASCDDG